MGHNGCDGSQASGPWAIGSGYRFTSTLFHTPKPDCKALQVWTCVVQCCVQAPL